MPHIAHKDDAQAIGISNYLSWEEMLKKCLQDCNSYCSSNVGVVISKELHLKASLTEVVM